MRWLLLAAGALCVLVSDALCATGRRLLAVGSRGYKAARTLAHVARPAGQQQGQAERHQRPKGTAGEGGDRPGPDSRDR
jgi:hypothetical protein